MKINFQESLNLENPEEINRLFELDDFNTFKETTIRESLFDDKKYFIRHQQYYKDILVEGGGYTFTKLIPDVPGGCEYLYLISPYVISYINTTVEPVIQKLQLKEIIRNYHNTVLSEISDLREKLVITSPPDAPCDYILAWKVDYSYGDLNSIWINAESGEVINMVSRHVHLTANTQDYGTKTLVDNPLGDGMTALTSPDGGIKIYDFNAFGGFGCQNHVFDENIIPRTNHNTEWPEDDASSGLTQALYSATLLKTIFADDFEVNFGNLHIGVDCRVNNSSTFDSNEGPRIILGLQDGVSHAVHDIIGHEMGHIAIRLDLSSDGIKTGSLHEGIADMFGTYAEAIIQMGEGGSPDWIIGDDADGLAERFNRNLKETNRNCFTDVEDSGSKHDRSEPLGHWFYLLSQGSLHVSPIGMKKTLSLVLETLLHISMNDSDYPELRDAMITIVEDTYGVCSDEAVSVTNAWHQICVGEPSSCFKIDGPEVVCEESNFMHFYITNPIQESNHYIWTFPLGWTVSNNQTQVGNSVVDTYLRVVDLPEYDYYPQHFTVKVYNPLLGSTHTQSKHVTIRDCDGDDPTCVDYFDSNIFIENRSGNIFIDEKTEKITSINVYNIYGQLVYQGLETNFSKHHIDSSVGIYIFCYFDEFGKFVKSEKRILTTGK